LTSFKLVVIDEASMVSTELFDFVKKALKKAKQLRGRPCNTKIIYMGDEYQLTPINESMSPALQPSKDVKVVNLTEVMRQEGDNPLLDTLDIMRDGIRDSKPVTLEDNYCAKSAHGLRKVNFDEPTEVRATIEGMLKDFPDSNKVVCFTNARVQAFNQRIRSKLIFPGEQDILVTGDRLMSYRTVLEDKDADGFGFTRDLPPMRGEFLNSCEYIVSSCDKMTHKRTGMKGFKLTLCNNDDGSLVKNVFIIDHTDADTLDTYNTTLGDLKSEALNAAGKYRRMCWKDFYKFQERYLCMIDTYHVKRSIDYAYAITVHKSQGSTYDAVTMDFNDISKCRDIQERNRLLYVAASRTRNTTHMLC
jgi:exodeoxyribonuclease-5